MYSAIKGVKFNVRLLERQVMNKRDVTILPVAVNPGPADVHLVVGARRDGELDLEIEAEFLQDVLRVEAGNVNILTLPATEVSRVPPTREAHVLVTQTGCL